MRGRGVLGPALLSLLLAAGGVALARAADRAREPAARAARGVPPLGVLNVLGVDLLWIRADALFAENRWPEMLAAYEASGRLEPRLAASWEFHGFHLAYNLAGNAASEEDRDRWVVEGVRVLEKGLLRNPGDRDLAAWLGRTLHERSERWPSLVPLLRSARGRDPLDEAVERLAAAVEADPRDGRNVGWHVEARAGRAIRALRAAPPGEPVPQAEGDLRAADRSLERLAPSLEEEGREAVRRLRRRIEVLLGAAASRDPAERERVLRELPPGPDGGK